MFQSVLCPVVMRHFEASRNTEMTIKACLESADALLRTSNVKDSLSYLDKADEIIVNLDGKGKDGNVWTELLNLIKGTKRGKYDIVKGIEEGETNYHNLDEIVNVYKVPKQIRAFYQMLYGDARVLMGAADRRHGKTHYLRACDFLGESAFGQLSCRSTDFQTEEERLQKIELWRRIGQNEMNTASEYSDNQLSKVAQKLMKFTKDMPHTWYEIDARIFKLYQCALEPNLRNGDLSFFSTVMIVEMRFSLTSLNTQIPIKGMKSKS